MEEPKTTEKLTYDDRRKVLIQEKTQIVENRLPAEKNDKGEEVQSGELMSTTEQSMKNTFTEEGIKLAYQNISKHRSFVENRISQLKNEFENEIKLTDEELKLQKMLKRIKQSESVEKAKAEYDRLQTDLKAIKKDMQGIKDAVGSRIKL